MCHEFVVKSKDELGMKKNAVKMITPFLDRKADAKESLSSK